MANFLNKHFFRAVTLLIFQSGPTLTSFCLFSNTNFTEKGLLERDSNSHRWSKTQARWPLDHHHRDQHFISCSLINSGTLLTLWIIFEKVSLKCSGHANLYLNGQSVQILVPMWPDVEIKSTQNFSKNFQKTGHNSFYLEVMFFNLTKKWPYIWAIFEV